MDLEKEQILIFRDSVKPKIITILLTVTKTKKLTHSSQILQTRVTAHSKALTNNKPC
jgi:hypothetical protein